jgi:hypothetical protein
MSSLQATLESNARSRGRMDGKRGWWLLDAALPGVGLLFVLGAMAGGPGALLWLLPLAFYGIAPLIDVLIGKGRVNALGQGLGYSCCQVTARRVVRCASTMSNAELTMRRFRS